MSLLWSSRRLNVASPSEPVLIAALIGFDAGEALGIAASLNASNALPAHWRMGHRGGSDLWIVNGQAVRETASHELEVNGMRFSPCEVRRPIAFATPLHPSIDARFRFNPESATSLDAMLAALSPWLLPRTVQQTLIGYLLANATQLTRRTVVHVTEGDRLLAVMNFGGETGVATNVTPDSLLRAEWHQRPPSAGFVPSLFHSSPTEEVLWRFATRADRFEILPARYLRLPIYLRRTPGLAHDELSPRQAELLAAITSREHTFRELRSRLDSNEADLRRELGAFYLVGAITCDPQRSLAATQRRRALGIPSMPAELSTHGSSVFDVPRVARRLGEAIAAGVRR